MRRKGKELRNFVLEAAVLGREQRRPRQVREKIHALIGFGEGENMRPDNTIKEWTMVDEKIRTFDNFFEEPEELDLEHMMILNEKVGGNRNALSRCSSSSSSSNSDVSAALRYMCSDLFDEGQLRGSGCAVRTRSPSPVGERNAPLSPRNVRSGSVSPLRSVKGGQDITKATTSKVMRSCLIGASAIAVLASATTMKPKLTRSIELDYSNSHFHALLSDAGSMLSAPPKAASFDSWTRTFANEAMECAWSKHDDEQTLRLRGGKQSRGETEHSSHSSESSGQVCQDCTKAGSPSESGKPSRQDSEQMILLGGRAGTAGFRPKLSRTVDLH